MHAAQLSEPFSWRMIDVPEPVAPGPGEAVLRVHSVGVCGTDYSGYQGKMPFFSYPRIPGHELGVEVVAIGSGVSHLKVGDRCAVEPYLNCQQCYACQRGHTNCCEHNQTLGVHCDGGLRPLITLPARKVHPANGLDSSQAALVETLAIGCHAVDRSAAARGQSVLVIGAGPIGLSVIEFVKLSGARPIVIDISPTRLAFCRERMGVTDTIQAGPNAEGELQVLTDNRYCDAVIDATGSYQSMSSAMQFCAFAGKLIYVGITQQELSFPHAPLLHRRELSILASRNALAKDFTRIIDLIRSKQIDTQPWITHRAPFESFIEQFPLWMQPTSGVIKAVVDLGG
jgi:2-desacetyl-2-hydroxyethyl bacteriochlorophyllide A dehydrogenase